MLAKVREAAELGELDALIEKQAHYGSVRPYRLTPISILRRRKTWKNTKADTTNKTHGCVN